jgi:hypothetical protein
MGVVMVMVMVIDTQPPATRILGFPIEEMSCGSSVASGHRCPGWECLRPRLYHLERSGLDHREPRLRGEPLGAENQVTGLTPG